MNCWAIFGVPRSWLIFTCSWWVLSKNNLSRIWTFLNRIGVNCNNSATRISLSGFSFYSTPLWGKSEANDVTSSFTQKGCLQPFQNAHKTPCEQKIQIQNQPKICPLWLAVYYYSSCLFYLNLSNPCRGFSRIVNHQPKNQSLFNKKGRQMTVLRRASLVADTPNSSLKDNYNSRTDSYRAKYSWLFFSHGFEFKSVWFQNHQDLPANIRDPKQPEGCSIKPLVLQQSGSVQLKITCLQYEHVSFTRYRNIFNEENDSEVILMPLKTIIWIIWVV